MLISRLHWISKVNLVEQLVWDVLAVLAWLLSSFNLYERHEVWDPHMHCPPTRWP